jgi:hypothetical protein
MIFFPLSFHPLEFSSPYPVDEVMEALYEHIRPKRALFQSRQALPRGMVLYEGAVGESGFWMTRVMRRAYFMPVIQGRVEPFDGGSKLFLRAGMRPFTAVFCGLYFLFALYDFGAGLARVLDEHAAGGALNWDNLTRGGFLLAAGLILCVGPYLSEKGRAVRALTHLLDLKKLKRFDSSRQAI